LHEIQPINETLCFLSFLVVSFFILHSSSLSLSLSLSFAMNTIYLSFDVECDGRSPAVNSMISLGIAAFTRVPRQGWAVVSTFKVNITPIEGRPSDQVTFDEFWSKWPAKWEACKVDAKSPRDAMTGMFVWLYTLSVLHPSRKQVWVAGPAAFDWQWVNYYYYAFSGPTVHKLHYAADCLSTLKRYYCVLRGLKGREKREFCDALAGRANADPHDALQDAIHQGWEWVHLMDEIEGVRQEWVPLRTVSGLLD
jgi:hypothetical protein